MCNVCNVKGLTPPDVVKLNLHRYTHPLVRCTERAPLPTPPPAPTMEDRVAAMEAKMQEKIDALSKSLGMKLNTLQQTLDVVERTISSVSERLGSSESNVIA